jgi:hypothetical protein
MCESSISSNSSCRLSSYIIFLFLYRSFYKSLAVNGKARWARAIRQQVLSPVTILLYPLLLTRVPSPGLRVYIRLRRVLVLRFIHFIDVLSTDCSLFFPLFLNKLHEAQSLLNWSHSDQESTLPLGNPKFARYIAQSWVTRPQFTPSYAFCHFFLFVFIILSLSSNCLLLLQFFYSSLFLPPFSIPSLVSFRVFLLNPSSFYLFLYLPFYELSRIVGKRPLTSCPSVCLPCLCVRPHVSTRLPLDGFPWSFMLGTFTKTCWETPNLMKVGQKYRTLYVKTQVRVVVAGDTHSP